MSLRTRYLATTLALVAVGLGFGLSQWRPRPGPPKPPPMHTGGLPARPALPPTVDQILERADDLRLSPRQARRLRDLDREWRVDRQPLEQAVRDAQDGFAAFMTKAREGRGASIAEMQRESADLRAVSAELRERRALHSAQALAVLSEHQRQQLRS